MAVFLHPGCEMSSSKLKFFKEVTLQTFLMSSLWLNFNIYLCVSLSLCATDLWDGMSTHLDSLEMPVFLFIIIIPTFEKR